MKITNKIIIACLLITSQLFSQSKVEDINKYDESGKTLLINAALSDDFEQVKILLAKGANVNLKEEKGLQGTPLMFATSTGNVKLCELLLDNGANIDELDINKDHALNWATYYGFVDIMSLLIERGTDLNLKSKHGTAVDVAFRLWHHDSVAQPFKNSLLAKKLTKSEHELISAIKSNNIQLADKLLRKNNSPNTTDELETPILQLAAQKGSYEMVKLLIEHKANLNILNRVGQTPLAWASRFGHISVADLLLCSGADANATGEQYKLTPLIGASVNGNASITALLIENNAIVDTKDVVNNASALHWAIWYKHSDIANVLLQHSADYDYKALDNTYSAYDVAKLNKMDDVLITMKAITESKNKLIGSWKVQEIHYLYPDSTYVFKEQDYGRFIFTNSNYALMYNPRMQKRIPFNNLSKPEPEETINAFRSIVFNTGTYNIKDDVVNTTADIAKVPGFEGGKQFYRITFNEEGLELVMFDETYPDGNKPEWYGNLKVRFILIKD